MKYFGPDLCRLSAAQILNLKISCRKWSNWHVHVRINENPQSTDENETTTFYCEVHSLLLSWPGPVREQLCGWKGRGRSRLELWSDKQKGSASGTQSGPLPLPFFKTSQIMSKLSCGCKYCSVWSGKQKILLFTLLTFFFFILFTSQRKAGSKRSTCVILKSIYFRTCSPSLHLQQCHFGRITVNTLKRKRR